MFYNLASKIRGNAVLKYIKSTDIHLDIGAGNGYLLGKSPATYKAYVYTHAEDNLPRIKTELFSIITMVAVFEHLLDNKKVLYECIRLLTKDGIIVMTTPTILGYILTPLVSYHDSIEHRRVITKAYMQSIVPNKCIMTHKIFEFGLNQIFTIRKR